MTGGGPTGRFVSSCLALATGVALLAGCAASDPAATGTAGGNVRDGQTLTVFAAASLTDAFTELASEFEDSHPGASVSLSFAGSADLVSQVTEGAPADVVAFADENTMARLTDAGLIDGIPELFASNTLAIAVPPGNPAGITSFQDLARPGARVVTCAEQVPCGAATSKIEKSTGVTLAPVSEESAVTDVLGKVSSGEADAGLVYTTDVESAGDAVDSIAFPEAASAVNRYPIGVVAASARPDLATEFVALVTGAGGRKILAAAGFAKP